MTAQLTPVPVGTVTVPGVVINTRSRRNNWGRTEWKMTFLADDGWRVWVTMPITPVLDRGDRIELTVTVTGPRDGDDPTFGHGKCPRVEQRLSPTGSPTST